MSWWNILTTIGTSIIAGPLAIVGLSAALAASAVIFINLLNRRTAQEQAEILSNTVREKIQKGEGRRKTIGLRKMITRDKNGRTFIGVIHGNDVTTSEVQYNTVDPEFDKMLNRNRGQVLSLENG
jgi:hypothetical protein